MEQNFKVSICMITYNHENFIAQAIEGVLMQKTNFQFELIIGEDCSTDSTRKICIEYQKKFPDKIKLRLPEMNLGGDLNFIQNLENCCQGYKYTAMCEGDDFWIDPNKLQQQVDYLQQNLKCGLVYTDVQIFNQETQSLQKVVPRFVNDETKVIAELIKSKYIEFASVVLRTSLLYKLLGEVFIKEFRGNIILDTRLILEFAHHSKIGYLPITTSVYRHVQGSASRPTNIAKYLIASKDSYQLRRNFILKYNYTTTMLAIPVCNFNRAIIFKSFETSNYSNVIKLISNLKIADMINFCDFKTFSKKIDVKVIIKFSLSILGIRAFILAIKK